MPEIRTFQEDEEARGVTPALNAQRASSTLSKTGVRTINRSADVFGERVGALDCHQQTWRCLRKIRQPISCPTPSSRAQPFQRFLSVYGTY